MQAWLYRQFNSFISRAWEIANQTVFSQVAKCINFIDTERMQAPIFACSLFLTYEINLVVDPSEIFFSSKKAWKINVVCINSKQRRQSQATAISLRLKYNYDPRLVIIIMIIIIISFYTPESDSLIYVGLKALETT